MPTRFETASSFLFALALFGCPLWDGPGSQAVSVGPVHCNLASSTDGSIEPTYLDCQITVAGTRASKQEIQASVTGKLEEDILPYLCPIFNRTQFEANAELLSEEIGAELSDAYDGSGWQIKAAHCGVSE